MTPRVPTSIPTTCTRPGARQRGLHAGERHDGRAGPRGRPVRRPPLVASCRPGRTPPAVVGLSAIRLTYPEQADTATAWSLSRRPGGRPPPDPGQLLARAGGFPLARTVRTERTASVTRLSGSSDGSSVTP